MFENITNNIKILREKMKKEYIYHVNLDFFEILGFFLLILQSLLSENPL